MWKAIIMVFLILNFSVFGQTVEIINRTHFRIDSIEMSIAKIKYLKKIEEPFISGGDGKFARKAQITFQLKNSSFLSLTVGDSLYIEQLVLLRKDLTEYYLLSDLVTEKDSSVVYTYTLAQDATAHKYHLILSSFYLNNKKHFTLINVDSKDLMYAFNLIGDLQRV